MEQELYSTIENFNLACQNQYPDARKFNQGHKIHPQERYYRNSNIRYQGNNYSDRSYDEGPNRRLNNTRKYNKEFRTHYNQGNQIPCSRYFTERRENPQYSDMREQNQGHYNPNSNHWHFNNKRGNRQTYKVPNREPHPSTSQVQGTHENREEIQR